MIIENDGKVTQAEISEEIGKDERKEKRTLLNFLINSNSF
jgi:hypothetical protein